MTDLTWEVRQQRVINQMGDIMARVPRQALRAVQQVIDKWSLVRTVRRVSVRRAA